MGLTHFQSIIIFLGLFIDNKGKYFQKFSNNILAGAKLKVKVNFKVKYNFATNKGRKKCKTSFSCNFD